MNGNKQVGLVRHFRSLLLVCLLAWQLGCGDSRISPAANRPPASNISLSPATAPLGSPDLTLTISATQQFSFTSAGHKSNRVVWTADGIDTSLTSAFLGVSQLTALVPAHLLASPVQAKVRVEVWDFMGDVPDATSSSVPFNVTAAPTASPFIASISPTGAQADSSDVTITITGGNFDNQFLHTSVAFWATNPNNLHDTGTMLHTRFVSSSELTAVVPAALLQDSVSVQIVVLTGDIMGMSDGYFGYPKSNSVTFTVTP
jgi:hypothetical protein